MAESGNLFDDQTTARLFAMLREWEGSYRLQGVTQPTHERIPGTIRRRFELKDTLVAGTSATGYLRKSSGGVVGTTAVEFEVYDELGEFEGDIGVYGMAEYWSDSGHWEVYQMGCE